MITVDHIAHHHHMTDGAALPSFNGLTVRKAVRLLRDMIADGSFGDMGGMELDLTDGTILEVENTPEHLMGAQRIRRADHHHETIRWYKV